MNKIKLIFVFFLLAHSNDVLSQIILNNYELDSITIISPKFEFNNKEFQKIKKKELELAPIKNIDDVLLSKLNVSIQKSQSGSGSPNVRGMEASRLQLIFNGISLNNCITRSGHSQNLKYIDYFNINDVYTSSSNSVGFGSGIMNSAIYMNSAPIRKSDSLNSSFFQEFSSALNSSKMNLSSVYRFGKFDAFTSISINDYGLIKAGKNRAHGYDDWGDLPHMFENERQRYTQNHSVYLTQRISKNISDFSIANIDLYSSNFSKLNRIDKLNDLKEGVPKFEKWYYGPQNYFLSKLSLLNYKSYILSDKFEITAAYQKLNESRHKKKYVDSFQSNRYEDLDVVDSKMDFKKNFTKSTLNYGISNRVEILNSKANLTDSICNAFYNSTRYPDGGSYVVDNNIYAQIQYKINDFFSLTLGGGLNDYLISSEFNDTSIINLGYKKLELNNLSIIKNFSLNYAKSNLVINFKLFDGFRNPNVDDMTKIFSKDDKNVVVPNNNLSPEKVSNYEIATTYITNKFELSFNSYLSLINNAISREFSQINNQDSILYDGEIMRVQMNKNIDNITIYGFEIFTKSLFANNYTMDNKVIFTAGLKSNNDPLAHIAPIQIKNNFKKKIGNSYIALSHTYYGKKDNEDFDLSGIDNLDEATIDGIPSVNFFDVSYFNQINKNIIINFSIENIFDIHHKFFSSAIVSNGRNYVISLQKKF